MSAQRNYRADLWQALADWKDAGGSIADVVAAIDAFVQSKIDRTAVQPTAGQREVETFTGTCRNCGMPALDHDWTFRGLRCPTVQAPSRGPLKVCRRSSSNLTGGTPCDCATPADCTMMRATSQTPAGPTK